MKATSLSLLDRLRNAAPDDTDWHQLQDIYLPLVRTWLRRVPAVGEALDDLTQEVFMVLVRELPSFERRRDGSFRCWLRQITLNRIRTYRRASRKRPHGGEEREQFLAQLEDPTSDLSRQWDSDHDQHVFQKLMAAVKPDFQPTTPEAFTCAAWASYTRPGTSCRADWSSSR